MKLRIGVGVTEEWVEQAVPLLEASGLRMVASSIAPGSEGEYVECDFDYDGSRGGEPEELFDLVERVRAIVEGSMVPRMHVRFVP